MLPADHPLVAYAALIDTIKTEYIEDHDDVDAHPRWKRVLKALGEPDYADYGRPAMTSQQAQTCTTTTAGRAGSRSATRSVRGAVRTMTDQANPPPRGGDPDRRRVDIRHTHRGR